jgi:hypothetical protein
MKIDLDKILGPSPGSRARDHGYTSDPQGARHRHAALDNELDFEVCRCGFVRYPKGDWIAGKPFPGWGPWERPALGLVRLPQFGGDRREKGSQARAAEGGSMKIPLSTKKPRFYVATSMTRAYSSWSTLASAKDAYRNLPKAQRELVIGLVEVAGVHTKKHPKPPSPGPKPTFFDGLPDDSRLYDAFMVDYDTHGLYAAVEDTERMYATARALGVPAEAVSKVAAIVRRVVSSPGSTSSGSSLRTCLDRQALAKARYDAMPTKGHSEKSNGKTRERGMPLSWEINLKHALWSKEDGVWSDYAPLTWRSIWEGIVDGKIEEHGDSMVIETRPVKKDRYGKVVFRPHGTDDRLVEVEVHFTTEVAAGDEDVQSESDIFVVTADEDGFNKAMELIDEVEEAVIRLEAGPR